MTTIMRAGGNGPFSKSSLRNQIQRLEKDLLERPLNSRARARAEATLAKLLIEFEKPDVPLRKEKKLCATKQPR